MSKTAREVIAEHYHDYAAKVDEQLGDYDADAIIAALDAAGFVIVPREPTPEILEAIREELHCIDTNQGGESGPVPGLEEDAERAAYHAMIAVVSQEPKP